MSIDRSLHEMQIPTSLLAELRLAGDFSSEDFQLDGVNTVTELGRHTEKPQPVVPKFEWLRYGTPAAGLKWRKVPLESGDLFYGKLAKETVERQMRMTRRAQQAYGRDHANAAPDFVISQTELEGQKMRRQSVSEEDAHTKRQAALLQGCARRMLLRQLYPWIHISRLASYVDKSAAKRKSRARTRKGSLAADDLELSAAFPPPELPWCAAWSSLEPQFELDTRTTLVPPPPPLLTVPHTTASREGGGRFCCRWPRLIFICFAGAAQDRRGL